MSVDDSRRRALIQEYDRWISSRLYWNQERDPELLVSDIEELMTNKAFPSHPVQWREDLVWLQDYVKRFEAAEEDYWARWDQEYSRRAENG